LENALTRKIVLELVEVLDLRRRSANFISGEAKFEQALVLNFFLDEKNTILASAMLIKKLSLPLFKAN
jgi:hypothetical protein